MIKSERIKAGVAVALWMVAGFLWGQQMLGEFRVPEYNDQGVKVSELTGNSAVIRGSLVEMKDFAAVFYESDGETVKMKVMAPGCEYNRKGRIAKSPGAVRLENPRMVVTGEDFAWDGQRELFKIFKDAKVVIKGSGRAALEEPRDSE